MQDDLEKTGGMEGRSVEEMFLGIQESYEAAQQRAQEENRAFARTEFFRMDKLGVYRLRVLPLAPNADGTASRPGYEFPVHQLLLELEKPTTGNKAQKMYVTVTRATDAGYSVDPIETYRRLAVAQAKEQGDEEKLGKVLNDAKFEDPTILVEYSKELKQTIIQGQGEHHLNILRTRIEKENKLAYEYIAPKIPYRETITKVAQADYRHKKQSGGAGQFGEVHMIIEPYYEGIGEPKNYKVPGKGDMVLNPKTKEEYDLPWGGKLQFYSAIVGGAIDARFMPAILKGIMEKMDEGPLTGSYARDIRVVIYDGKMHPVDSNEISFKLAARNAFKEAFRNAGPKIMEPIYSVEVLVPSEYMGAVMSDLQNRRAMIAGMESDKGFDRLNALVPLAELYRYSTTLSSLTSGSATYSMKFGSYEQVPADVQEKLLKAYTDTDDE